MYAIQNFVPFLPASFRMGASHVEENMPCKNSTLLDISKAVAIEKVPEFSNLSAILGKFHILFPHVTKGKTLVSIEKAKYFFS